MQVMTHLQDGVWSAAIFFQSLVHLMAFFLAIGLLVSQLITKPLSMSAFCGGMWVLQATHPCAGVHRAAAQSAAGCGGRCDRALPGSMGSWSWPGHTHGQGVSKLPVTLESHRPCIVWSDACKKLHRAWNSSRHPTTIIISLYVLLMIQVLEKQEDEALPELDLSTAPLPPTEHVVDEGASPEATGYEILLQVPPLSCTASPDRMPPAAVTAALQKHIMY